MELVTLSLPESPEFYSSETWTELSIRQERDKIEWDERLAATIFRVCESFTEVSAEARQLWDDCESTDMDIRRAAVLAEKDAIEAGRPWNHFAGQELRALCVIRGGLYEGVILCLYQSVLRAVHKDGNTETWMLPNIEHYRREATLNFQAMRERWTEKTDIIPF